MKLQSTFSTEVTIFVLDVSLYNAQTKDLIVQDYNAMT